MEAQCRVVSAAVIGKPLCIFNLHAFVQESLVRRWNFFLRFDFVLDVQKSFVCFDLQTTNFARPHGCDRPNFPTERCRGRVKQRRATVHAAVRRHELNFAVVAKIDELAVAIHRQATTRSAVDGDRSRPRQVNVDAHCLRIFFLFFALPQPPTIELVMSKKKCFVIFRLCGFRVSVKKKSPPKFHQAPLVQTFLA